MVSVIIPMYNSEDTIWDCILSVANQSFKGEIEIIVVNDGSTDKSVLILNEIVSKKLHSDLKIISKVNGGVSSARNLGLAQAKGNYIAFLDSDDAWLSNKLEIQIGYMEKYPFMDFIGGLIFSPKNRKIKFKEITLKHLIFKNYFQPSTVLFRRQVIEEVGFFDESQKYAEEGNYFIRVAKVFRCFLILEKLVIYGQGKKSFGESGLSANLIEMEKGELRNIYFAYKSGFISILIFLLGFGFSILKFLRRFLIVFFRNYV